MRLKEEKTDECRSQVNKVKKINFFPSHSLLFTLLIDWFNTPKRLVIIEHKGEAALSAIIRYKQRLCQVLLPGKSVFSLARQVKTVLFVLESFAPGRRSIG